MRAGSASSAGKRTTGRERCAAGPDDLTLCVVETSAQAFERLRYNNNTAVPGGGVAVCAAGSGAVGTSDEEHGVRVLCGASPPAIRLLRGRHADDEEFDGNYHVDLVVLVAAVGGTNKVVRSGDGACTATSTRCSSSAAALGHCGPASWVRRPVCCGVPSACQCCASSARTRGRRRRPAG
jgi:hypothetical protein